METLPEFATLVGQALNVGLVELLATVIDEWQREEDAPMLIQRVKLPPPRCRVLLGAVYVCAAVRFFA